MVKQVEESLTIDPFSKMSFDSFRVEEIPQTDENALRYFGDGMTYAYQHPVHDLRAILRPNYSNRIFRANKQAYHGALLIVTICNGSRDPSTWTTMLARVVKISSSFHADESDPTLIGIICRWGKCSVATHSNEDLEN